MAMIQSGGNLVDIGDGKHIFQIFARGRVLSTFHYSLGLAGLIWFILLALTSARKNHQFALAGYFFTATLFMYISGGQRMFGEPLDTFGNVHFVAMASVFVIPLLICLGGMTWSLWGRQAIPPRAVRNTLAAMLVLMAFTDGLHHGMTPGPLKACLNGEQFQATTWENQKHSTGHHSFSIPSVLKYYHSCRSRIRVQEGQKPLGIHYLPYSHWKHKVPEMRPVQDIMAFISMSRPKS